MVFIQDQYKRCLYGIRMIQYIQEAGFIIYTVVRHIFFSKFDYYQLTRELIYKFGLYICVCVSLQIYNSHAALASHRQ